MPPPERDPLVTRSARGFARHGVGVFFPCAGACMACAGACMACAYACMAGGMAGALQQTPWQTPAVWPDGRCLLLPWQVPKRLPKRVHTPAHKRLPKRLRECMCVWSSQRGVLTLGRARCTLGSAIAASWAAEATKPSALILISRMMSDAELV